VALRSAGAWALWLGVAIGVLCAALDLAQACRGDRPAREAMVGSLAGIALSFLLAGMAALPAAALAAFTKRPAVARLCVRASPLLALVAGTALAWYLADPLRRRLVSFYVVFCLATGTAVAAASWLARERRALPEMVAAALLACAGAAIVLVIPMDSYEELQDLGFVIALAGVLAATSSMFGRLERWRAAPFAAGAALLASLGALWAMDELTPGWRAAVNLRQPGAMRVTRAFRALIDVDRDGFSPILQGGDCDDTSAAVHPLALDLPGGQDANCNGVDAPTATSEVDRGLAAASGDPSLSAGAVDRLILITVDCWRADALDPSLMPEVSAFAAGGMVLERLYAAGSSTLLSMPMILGVGPRGPWVAEIAERRGILVDAVVAGSVPGSLWGFRRTRGLPPAAEQVTRAALELIEAAPTGRQLLWLHYFDLHALGQFRGESVIPPGPAQFPPSYRIGARHIDRAIGQLISELDRRGMLARTMVVITGDHGEGFGAHGISRHGQSGFEEVIHVPGILRGPGIPAARVPQLVSHRDLPATLLGGLGLSADASAAERLGRSWLRLREVPRRPLHSFVLARSARRVSGRLPTALLGVLVTDRYKLVAGLEDGLFELYDVVADPHETHDLAGVHDDLRRTLWRQLALAWEADYQGLDTE
jgi:hypothetical protein